MCTDDGHEVARPRHRADRGQRRRPAHRPEEVRVSDDDTIAAYGKVYRLVGFNAPETFQAKCAEERALGVKADKRLRELVDGGALDLTEVPRACPVGTKDGDPECNYGRYCAVLKARGVDVGQTFIAEGLAEVYICGAHRCPRRRDWCTG
jgi:endonuclease YncB( thermonuclease family)